MATTEKWIVYGDKEYYYAKIKTDDDSPSFDTPVRIYGMRGFSSEVEQEDTPIYADDMVYATIPGVKTRTGEATVLYVPSDYAQMALGYVKMTNGMLVDTGEKQTHCIFYVQNARHADTGEITQIIHYYYAVTASEGEIETATIEDEVEANEMTIAYTCANSAIAKDSQNNGVAYGKIMRTTENATLFDTYKTTVLLPTSTVGA